MPPVAPRRSRPRLRAAAIALCLAFASATSLAQTPEATAGEVRSLLARGEAARALPLAERLVAEQPGNGQWAFLLGVVLMDLRRDADALAAFERLHELYPELPDPLNNIGLLHARAGRLDAARASLDAALRNDPGHRTARLNLAQVHLMLALRAWEQAAAQAALAPELRLRMEAVRAWVAGPNR